jgi:hypothetical protein
MIGEESQQWNLFLEEVTTLPWSTEFVPLNRVAWSPNRSTQTGQVISLDGDRE